MSWSTQYNRYGLPSEWYDTAYLVHTVKGFLPCGTVDASLEFRGLPAVDAKLCFDGPSAPRRIDTRWHAAP